MELRRPRRGRKAYHSTKASRVQSEGNGTMNPPSAHGFQRFSWSILLWVVVARAESLKVATYNVENYGPANRITEAGYRKDYPKPEPEKRALRTVIRALNADVLVVQEMGPQVYLDELRRDLKSEGLDYPHATLATAADTDRHLAVMSKRPLVAVTTHTDLQFKYF